MIQGVRATTQALSLAPSWHLAWLRVCPLLMPKAPLLCTLGWSRICLQCRRTRFNPWVRKILWRRTWKPGSQHAGEKRGVAGLLLGRTERAARAAELQLCAQAR